jgi:tRNA 2-thiouridine synthesizing protein A
MLDCDRAGSRIALHRITGARRHATMTADQELDVTGLKCPLPILRTKKMLATMQSGQVLRVLATDPGSVQDFEAFCRQTGNTLLDSSEREQVFEYFLRRK